MLKYKLPFTLFISLVLLLALGLKLKPKDVPSPLINQPIPQFELPNLTDTQHSFHPVDLSGEVWILNVWASWCVSCREEHQQLLNLQQQSLIKLVGFNYKDDPDAACEWLKTQGNPYNLIVADRTGETAIDLGVYGVPETYIIDKHGVVRYKHTGPLHQHELETLFMPLLHQLLAES